MNGTQRYTVWHYVGCGCVVLLLLGALVIGGVVWFGWRTAQDVAEGMRDPEVREARARELLGFEELPEGYHPGFALSIPWVVEMAVLGDRELPEGEEMSGDFDDDDFFEDRGFMFFKLRRFGGRDEMPGEAEYDFEADRMIREGEIEAGGARVEYRAQLGTSSVAHESFPSIAAEMQIDCDDRFHRFGAWFVRLAPESDDEGTEAAGDEPPAAGTGTSEAAPEAAPVAEPDYTGTPADEAALRAFLDHFELCR